MSLMLTKVFNQKYSKNSNIVKNYTFEYILKWNFQSSVSHDPSEIL